MEPNRDASPVRSSEQTVKSEPPKLPPTVNRYFLTTLYDPLCADECIVKPFTANGHTIQWICIQETEYYLDSDLAEEFLAEIVKKQFKHFDEKEGHDTSSWIMAKILLGCLP